MVPASKVSDTSVGRVDLAPSDHSLPRARSSQHDSGFSLIQLLVAVAIAIALMAAASPNIATVTRVYSVRSAARQVYSELQNARIAAVMANRPYTFTVLDGGSSYSIQAGSDAPVTMSLEAANHGVTISAPTAIVFTSRGTAPTSATVVASNVAGDSTAISVSTAGRIRIQ